MNTPSSASDTKYDHSGRNRIAWNVLTSWAGYIVFVVAGFVMPRMVDSYIGQTSLGVWDFCWSLVTYLSLADISIGTSVGRYVAKYRTAGDHDALRRAVSSVVAIQIAISLMVVVCIALLVWLLPRWLSSHLEEEINVIRWVVVFLGMGVAVHMAADTSRGVITGCHRWDLHNAINSISHLVSVLLMLASLVLGGGLVSMAVIYLVSVICTESWRIRTAYRVCPELSVHTRLVDWNTMITMLSYGGKTTLAGLAPLITLQTTNIMVAYALGPAMLAVFARPMALARHAQTFINKFSFVLTPIASSLKASGKENELKLFYLDATRYGFALTMPLLLVLGVFGDVILSIWMGPRYAQGITLAIIAGCYLLPVAQGVSMHIMMGTNSHGRVALMSLVITLLVFSAVALYIYSAGWTLERAALLAGLPLVAGNGLLVPFFACRQLKVGIVEYVRSSLSVPVLCNIAFAFILISARPIFSDNYILAFAAGVSVGLLVLSALYWKFLLSTQLRDKIRGMIGRIRRTG